MSEKMYSIICYRKADKFRGMILHNIHATEIKLKSGPLAGQLFLLHTVVDNSARWTVTHKESGLDVLGKHLHGKTPAQAKARALPVLARDAPLIRYASLNYCQGILYVASILVADGLNHGYTDAPADIEQKQIMNRQARAYVLSAMKRNYK